MLTRDGADVHQALAEERLGDARWLERSNVGDHHDPGGVDLVKGIAIRPSAQQSLTE